MTVPTPESTLLPRRKVPDRGPRLRSRPRAELSVAATLPEMPSEASLRNGGWGDNPQRSGRRVGSRLSSPADG